MISGLLKVGSVFRARLNQGWAWVWRKIGKEPLYRVARVEDEPNRPRVGVVYVIEDAGLAWAAAMACPGGCGQILHMNLIPDSKPVWKFTEEANGAATLHPSVWRKEGCGCHFVLRQGRVRWC